MWRRARIRGVTEPARALRRRICVKPLLPAVLAVVLVACTDAREDADPVRLVEAIACSDVQVLLLAADETQALRVGIDRELRGAGEATMEFDLADLDAELLSGKHLAGSACTDDPGITQVDDAEPVDAGTLSLSLAGGRADIALRDAHTPTTSIDDVDFEDEVVLPPAG
jgi:hypothetical protein